MKLYLETNQFISEEKSKTFSKLSFLFFIYMSFHSINQYFNFTFIAYCVDS